MGWSFKYIALKADFTTDRSLETGTVSRWREQYAVYSYLGLSEIDGVESMFAT